jgi:predicted HicB family RNase H-like nuclease
MTILTYKGYTGKVDIDLDSETLHGEVIDLKDVITFQADNVNDLTKAFQDSVDDYIEFCELGGSEPEKPFSGKFVLRLTSEQHKIITIAAAHAGDSLNAWAAKKLIKDARAELEESGKFTKADLEKV